MKIKLSKHQQETVLQRVWQDYQFGRAERDRHMQAWKDARKQYNSEWIALSKQQSDEELEQHFYVPKTRTTIDRIRADLLEHFFPQGRRKLAKVLPPSEVGQLPIAAKMADDVLHAKLDLEGQPDDVLPQSWEACFVDGDGWVRVRWDQAGAYPVIEAIENDNLVRDPYAKADKDIRWVIHEKYLTEEELWQRQRDGIFENVKLIAPGPDDARHDEWRKNVAGPGNKVRVLHKVLEFCGPVQIYSDEELERKHKRGEHPDEIDAVVTLYENKAVLRIEENDYAGMFKTPTSFEKLPYFKATPLPRQGTTYGDSMVTMMLPLQREINTLRNQRRIAVESEMNRKIFYDIGRLTNLEALYAAKYGGPVGVQGNPNEVVKDFSLQTSTAGMENEEMIMDSDLRDLTGVTHYKTGGVVEGMQKTATGVNAVMTESNTKIDVLIRNIGRTQVIPLAEFVLRCCVEWLTDEQVGKIVNAALPEDIAGPAQNPPSLKTILTEDFHVEVEAGASVTSKQVEIRNIEAALMMTAQMAGGLPQEAFATARAVLPRLLILLGLPEAAATFDQTADQMPAQDGMQGKQSGGIPNPGNERAMAQQGRSPTVGEMRR